MLVVLLGITGFALDYGASVVERRKAQNAADASALAGAATYPTSCAEARSQATLNGYTTGGSVTVITNCPPQQGPHTGDDKYVEVKIAKTVPTSFMGVLNINSVNINARAVARLGSAIGPPPCGVYVLNPTANKSLSGTGSAGLSTDSCIQVNSSANDAVNVTGNAFVHGVGTTYVRGGCQQPSMGQITPWPCTNAFTPSDPMASVGIPTGVPQPPSGQVGCSVSTQGTNCNWNDGLPHTIAPGVYHNILPDQTTLSPGIYIITGSVKASSASIKITGNGVMLYFACPSNSTPYWRNCNVGEYGGDFTLNGGAAMNLSAPTSGPYKGMLMFSDRNNTSTLTLTGGSTNTTTGTIYAKSGTITLNGQTGSQATFASLLIADQIRLVGGSAIPLAYNQSQNFNPAADKTAALVE